MMMKNIVKLLLCVSLVVTLFSSCDKDDDYEDFLDETIWVCDKRLVYFHDGKGEYYFLDDSLKAEIFHEFYDYYKVVNEKEAIVKLKSNFICKLYYHVNYINFRNIRFYRSPRSKHYYFD